MNNIIDAETARWAGLQIDLHSKFRSGNLTADQLEWWLNQPKYKRDALMALEPTEKFVLLADLGIITVPDDYDHATALAKFDARNRDKFESYASKITDRNFPNPTRVLMSGDKLRVRAFVHWIGDTTTVEERMAFLATQKAIHTGAQGLALVFEQKRNNLPKGRWYCSYDEMERFLVIRGDHWVPSMWFSDCDYSFGCTCFEDIAGKHIAFLCFTEVESTPV